MSTEDPAAAGSTPDASETRSADELSAPGTTSTEGTSAEAAPYVPLEIPPPPTDGLSAVLRDGMAGISEHAGTLGAVVDVLRDIYDPEIPVNIYDLGLVYDVQEVQPGRFYVRMTLTSPMCPVAESLPPEVKRRVEKAPGVREAVVDISWDPPWGPDKMSEAARLQLNFFY